jgi:hypothetical protein
VAGDERSFFVISGKKAIARLRLCSTVALLKGVSPEGKGALRLVALLAGLGGFSRRKTDWSALFFFTLNWFDQHTSKW